MSDRRDHGQTAARPDASAKPAPLWRARWRTAALLLLIGAMLLGSLLGAGGWSLSAAQGPTAPPAAASDSAHTIAVNYAHGWVQGQTAAGAYVDVRVSTGDNATVDIGHVYADVNGWYMIECQDWDSGTCPDIQPGHSVVATASIAGGPYVASVAPVGAMPVDLLDADENRVLATLNAGWLSSPVAVSCEIWQPGAPPPIDLQVDSDGGAIICDFDDVGWDLQPGQMVAIRYQEPDGDSIINVAEWTWGRVNIGHDQVGGNYPAGQSVTVTVRDAGSAVKATAAMTSVAGWGWGSDGFDTEPGDWVPAQPDIVPGDVVTFEAGASIRSITVGALTGVADSATDSVTGTVTTDLTGDLTVECHPWGAWGAGIDDAPVKTSTAAADGSAPYACAWDPDTEWDMQPGQEIGVMYVEPDMDRVIDVFAEPTPHLRLEGWSSAVPAPGSNLRVDLRVTNDGDAPAENVLIHGVIDGLSYLPAVGDGGPTGSGTPADPLVWGPQTLDPADNRQRSFYVSVPPTAIVGSSVAMTLTITTTSPDVGDKEEKRFDWSAPVMANGAQLNVGKHALVGEPAPSAELIYQINICNRGDTSSGTVTVLDEPGPGQFVGATWSDMPGWEQQALAPNAVTATLASVNPGECIQGYVQAQVLASVSVGQPITNTVTISGGNDLSPEGNEATWEGYLAAPFRNLSVSMDWSGGQLITPGMLRYHIHYENVGNMVAAPVPITVTFPAGASFHSAWRHDPMGGYAYDPDTVTGTYAVWETDSLSAGRAVDFDITLQQAATAPGTALVARVTLGALLDELRLDDNVAEWTETALGGGANLRVTAQAHWMGEDHIQYDILFQNVGDSTITDVAITDMLPEGTTLEGDPWHDWDPSRVLGMYYNAPAGELLWELDELQPGEAGWVHLVTALDEPGARPRWYTNTVTITLPAGDSTPEDNAAETVTYTGSEVRGVEFWVEDQGPGSAWGMAEAGQPVTVTTAISQTVTVADAGDGSWGIDDVGPLAAGDTITVTAGQGIAPLVFTVPRLRGVADTVTDRVTGRVEGLPYRRVEIWDAWDWEYRQVYANAGGEFTEQYGTIPQHAGGHLRVDAPLDGGWVGWQWPLRNLDLLLEVNYGHDWIYAPYELGHSMQITVTNGTADVKGTMEVDSAVLPAMNGATGFSTLQGLWDGTRPDIVPGDRITATLENGHVASLVVGEITGTVDLAADTVSGHMEAPPYDSTPLTGWCSVWAPGGPYLDWLFAGDGFSYVCDLGSEGWDLQHGQYVAVGYNDLAGHRVFNVFWEPWRVFLPMVVR